MILDDNPDPAEVAASRAQSERFARNADWYQAHLDEIVAANRGKCICVAGQQLFVGDSFEEVLALARAAHPEEDGAYYTHYIHRERAWRIYAHRRIVEARR
jgi:hypothetical protein